MLRWTTSIVALLMTTQAHSAVWNTENKWSTEYENKFAEFIKSTPIDVFKNPNSYAAGIATDCADAAYTLRVLFAAREKLPVKFQNSDRLSNNSTEFDSITDDQLRLRKFVQLVNRETDTGTVTQDSYAVEVNRASIRPGTMFLNVAPRGPNVAPRYRVGHVYYLQNVKENGQIKYISSTVPIAVRDLGVRIGIEFAPQDSRGGYRNWKWPDSEERPGASDMQFRIANWHPDSYKDANSTLWDNWQEAVQSRIRTRLINTKERFEAASENLRSALNERAAAVQRGWDYYKRHYPNKNSCMSKDEYDLYSTPSRDEKIQYEMLRFQNAARQLLSENYNLFKAPGFFSDNSEDTRLQRLNVNFKVQILPGLSIDYNQLENAFNTCAAIAISEPEHSPLVRWGLKSIKEDGGWACQDDTRKKQYRGIEQCN